MVIEGHASSLPGRAEFCRTSFSRRDPSRNRSVTRFSKSANNSWIGSTAAKIRIAAGSQRPSWSSSWVQPR